MPAYMKLYLTSSISTPFLRPLNKCLWDTVYKQCDLWVLVSAEVQPGFSCATWVSHCQCPLLMKFFGASLPQPFLIVYITLLISVHKVLFFTVPKLPVSQITYLILCKAEKVVRSPGPSSLIRQHCSVSISVSENDIFPKISSLSFSSLPFSP